MDGTDNTYGYLIESSAWGAHPAMRLESALARG